MPPATQPPKNKRDFNWGRTSKTFAFWILILLIPVALIQISGNRSSESPKISYTRYRQELTRDNVNNTLLRAFTWPEIRARVTLDAVVTVVDAAAGTRWPAVAPEVRAFALRLRGRVPAG